MVGSRTSPPPRPPFLPVPTVQLKGIHSDTVFTRKLYYMFVSEGITSGSYAFKSHVAQPGGTGKLGARMRLPSVVFLSIGWTIA